jgi:hypothetical protein
MFGFYVSSCLHFRASSNSPQTWCAPLLYARPDPAPDPRYFHYLSLYPRTLTRVPRNRTTPSGVLALTKLHACTKLPHSTHSVHSIHSIHSIGPLLLVHVPVVAAYLSGSAQLCAPGPPLRLTCWPLKSSGGGVMSTGRPFILCKFTSKITSLKAAGATRFFHNLLEHPSLQP